MVARTGKRTKSGRGSIRGRRCMRKQSHHNHQLRASPVLLLQARRRRRMSPLHRHRRLPPPHLAAPMRRARLRARHTVGPRIVRRYRCIDVRRRSSIRRVTRSGTSAAAALAARCYPALVVQSGVTAGRRLVMGHVRRPVMALPLLRDGRRLVTITVLWGGRVRVSDRSPRLGRRTHLEGDG
jgi:hypothetical protein